LAGESGCVVGLTGAGKSNLLGFLGHRSEVLQSYWPEAFKVVLVQVDLNNLPGSDLATFYQVILRALYESRARLAALEPALATAVETLYRKIEDKLHPFLSQSALREALLLFAEQGVRLVLVFDPFDTFCQTAEPQVLDNLRGLRDSFKTILSYIVGVRQELAYLRDPSEIGEIYELLDTHLCWVGAMVATDARSIVEQTAAVIQRSFAEAQIERLIALTGSYPSLLRAASLWLASVSPIPEMEAWLEALLAERSLQYRLAEIWTGLTQTEQLVLSELEKWQSSVAEKGEPVAPNRVQTLDKTFQGLVAQYGDVLTRLTTKGLLYCRDLQPAEWRIRSDLLAAYVANVEGRGRGKIWLDEETDTLYQGQMPLERLTPLERAVLHFLVSHPRLRHTKTDLIVSAWPDELRQYGVTDQSLYQVILELRKKIEPNWTKPRYLITWRGKPEGGYQFFPEGKPG
jgi:hypothetical protein